MAILVKSNNNNKCAFKLKHITKTTRPIRPINSYNMKTNNLNKILICYLIAFLFTRQCKSQTEFKNIDKWAHFGFCYGISQTTYKIVEDKKQAFTIAFLTPMAIGTAKEGIDHLKGAKFSLSDLKADFIGALFGTFTYKVIINYKNRNKGNFENWNKKEIYGYDY